jgi:hypothetical protein
MIMNDEEVVTDYFITTHFALGAKQNYDENQQLLCAGIQTRDLRGWIANHYTRHRSVFIL